MEYQEQEKAHRLRIAIIAIIAILAAIIIGVGLIFAAINLTKKDQTSNPEPTTSNTSNTPSTSDTSNTSNASNTSTTPATSNSGSDRPATTAPTSTNTSSPADQYQTPPSPVAATTQSNDIPSTGPEEFIFPALLIGTAVYLIGLNLQLAKSRRHML